MSAVPERVYLDHAASAPLRAEAAAAMHEAWGQAGNPSSLHTAGRAARRILEESREAIAAALGARPAEVIFTSGGTEANNLILLGALGARRERPRVAIGGGAHPSVAGIAERIPDRVDVLALDATGRLRPDLAAIGPGTALVSVLLVNNETGVVQPVDRIEVLVGASPHYLFVDAVQAFGKIGLEFSARAPDMMAVSAHKIGGPAGVGALLMKGHADQVRLIPGGGQETGRRGGTESAALIAGFGAAAAAFADRYYAAGTAALVDKTEAGLRALAPDAVIFGGAVERIGNTSNFAVPGLKNAVAMMGLDLKGISISSGSACSSGKVGPSHVLKAMGVPTELGDCAMRLSVGWDSTKADIEAFLDGFNAVLERHRQRRGKAA